ncbi:Hypothetical protein I5071_5800 [Sandaracinus amylolyticus]|nr:Hypothetical protein I5071_5800 [Sandaracinus amylolyticus]
MGGHDAGSSDSGRSDSGRAPSDSGTPESDAGGPSDPRECVTPEAILEIASSGQGVEGHAVAIDGAGNLYVGGGFSDPMTVRTTTTLDPTGPNRRDGFVVSLTPGGAVRWARVFGDANDSDQTVVGAFLAGDLVIVSGQFDGELDLHVPGTSGDLPPIVSSPSRSSTGFVAALRASDGTPVFAHVYDGALAAAGGTEIVAAGGAHPACGATTGDLQVARLDVAALVTDPTTGARAPTCRRAVGFSGATITRAIVATGGDVLIAGTSVEDTFGTVSISRPAASTGSRPDGLVVRLSPDLAVRWARGYQTLPHPTHPHPSHFSIAALQERGGALVIAGRVLGAVDLGGGPMIGFTSGSDWDIAIAGLDPATGETRWSDLFACEGSDALAGIAADEEGQLHVAGRFGGPAFDVSGGVAPLAGQGQLFAATFGETGAHQCSRASTGGPGSTTASSTGTTPDGHEWLVVGSTVGSLDFGAGAIGDSSSPRSRVFVQRFSLVE